MQLTGNDLWKWGSAQQGAFKELKRLLAEEVVLAIPMEEGKFCIEADASEGAIGVVLSQEQDGNGAVRLANSLVRESRVCICKIFCICKEGYHPLWRDPIESTPSVDTIERSSPSVCLGCWTESGCVKIARERRIPCNPLAMLGSKVARYA